MDKEERDATALVVANAFGAMMKVFLVSVIGNPLLPMSVIRHLSRFSNIVLIPCLTIGNIGASISLSLLLRAGILVPIAIGSNLLSMLIGRILKFLHEDDQNLYRASLLTVASPNSISMPIMVMQSLCEQPTVNADYDDDPTVCFSNSTALLFIYSIGFNLLYWGYCFPSFEILKKEYDSQSNENTSLLSSSQNLQNTSNSSRVNHKITLLVKFQRFLSLIKHIFLSPTMIAVFLGLFVGLIPFTRQMLFSEQGYLFPIGGAINTLGTPVVALNCLIMSASLAHIEIDFKNFFSNSCYNFFKKKRSNNKLFKNNSFSSDYEEYQENNSLEDDQTQINNKSKNNLHNGNNGNNNNSSSNNNNNINNHNNVSYNPLQIQLSKKGHVHNLNNDLEDNNNIDEVNDIHINENDDNDNDNDDDRNERNKKNDEPKDLEKVLNDVIKDEGVEPSNFDTSSTGMLNKNENNLPQARSIIFLIVCRLIFPPLLVLFLIRLFVSNGLISKEERLFQLIIVIVSASPSAQVIIVSLNQLGFQKLAGQIAYMYVFQYLACILSITFIATTALSLIYP